MPLLHKLKPIFVITSLFFLPIFIDRSTADPSCDTEEITMIYLDSAMKMLQKAKDFYPSEYTSRMGKAVDCYDLLKMGKNASGIYTIWPLNRVMEGESLQVYCDMKTDGGGWTVIQRRGNFQRPSDYFFKEWADYKKGFGDLNKDFWLGNDHIYAISNQKQYTARFDMKAVDGEKKYAHYDFFWIDDENNKYMLHIRDYSGDAGDSMYPRHDNQKFSTKDQQNDNRKDSCTQSFKGAWWYNECHDSNLNGLYLRGKHDTYAVGVNWKTWRGYKESLEETEIKLRPKDFKSQTSTAKRKPGTDTSEHKPDTDTSEHKHGSDTPI